MKPPTNSMMRKVWTTMYLSLMTQDGAASSTSNLVENDRKIPTPNELNISNSKGNLTQSVQGTEIWVKNVKSLKPKLIMVRKIENIVEFSKKVESECDANFTAKISRRWIKLFTDSVTLKMRHFRCNRDLAFARGHIAHY